MRRKRATHFESFAAMLTPRLRAAVHRNYVMGRYGRALPHPARDRVFLHKALARLRAAGIELVLPEPLYGTNGTEEWADDDTPLTQACSVCGRRNDVVSSSPKVNALCHRYVRSPEQAAAHGHRYVGE